MVKFSFSKESKEAFSRSVPKLTDDFSKKLDDQSKNFHTWIGVQGEDFQHKLDLVVEGFQMLVEKIDRFEIKLDQVGTGLMESLQTSPHTGWMLKLIRDCIE